MVNTENDLLLLAETFKETIEKKNEEIEELKKVIISVYGVIRIASIIEEFEMVENLRTYLSDYLEEEFNIF
tara:strand:- start:527 stop:739 length:213 start_codon:yes stop_codon:yes gene_type:complete